MTSTPPPQGMTDVDYEAIEAAVTETVRGRWFLSEFARRNRAAEFKLLLDAMARVEATVTTGQAALPPPPSADPSIRLMVQRIKEISTQLEGLASIMREEGLEAHFCDVVEMQARAVANLMRNGSSPDARQPARLSSASQEAARAAEPAQAEPSRRLPHVAAAPFTGATESHLGALRAVAEALKPELAASDAPAPQAPAQPAGEDPRLKSLSRLDGLPLAKKLALFT